MFRILWDPSSKSIKRASLKITCDVSNFGTIPYKFDIPFHITGPNFTLPNTDYAQKTSQVVFSEARLILPEDGSQRIRNMSEFLIVF